MNFRLHKLILNVRKGVEPIEFTDFNYFYGRMGAGKSSIPRLIDFCLGGKLEMTPALQSEFVSCSLYLTVNNNNLEIERLKDSSQVRVVYEKDEPLETILPARAAAGEIIPGTGIEVLSDLIFYLAGVMPPKVKKSKLREDSPIERLSFRDLFWYCFLTQEELDSSFFNLDIEAHPFKKLKSQAVLRYILGFHQDKVTFLEVKLDQVRNNKNAIINSFTALKDAIEAAGIKNEEQIEERTVQINSRLANISLRLTEIRGDVEKLKVHAVEELRHKGQEIALELQTVEDAVKDTEKSISDHERHLNELIGLKFKFKRVSSARAVLEGVEFEFCPRCTQKLPDHPPESCNVCGLIEIELNDGNQEYEIIEKDADLRIKELEDIIKRQTSQLKDLRLRLSGLQQSKGRIDAEYTGAMKQYDSIYLSQAISIERRKAYYQKALQDLKRWRIIPQKITEQQKKADELAIEESRLRQELKETRAKAEKDLGNLRRLEYLFLDCLLRTKIPGYSKRDSAQIKASDFLPKVFSPETEDILVSSFGNLGSGGKKTLFKCCFAVAVHRLASEIEAPLPKVLIIDSPMKNISERENPEQFKGFYTMLYELAEEELKDTQFILVDNELFNPVDEISFGFKSRHMKPFEEDSIPAEEDLPLIRYYKGY